MLPGPAVLTAFESARMAATLRALDPDVVAVEASYLYLLLVHEGQQNVIDHTRLGELLGAGLELETGPRVWIGPRMGTQSPWSSKATDILHNPGFGAIERIERARVVRIVYGEAAAT
jgi:phosphoribosylformylglycinamidine synthase